MAARYVPTVLDVAREAGVSKSSAARVLAARGSSSAETRRRVTEAAARLGYRPNALAKAIKSGASATIGAVIPDVASPFFSTVVRGLTDAARAAGFEVIVASTDEDAQIEARTIELLAEKRVEGIIVAPALQEYPEDVLRIIEDTTPVVLLDRRHPSLAGVQSVSVDNVGAARLGVEHLLSLGHERIGIVTGSLFHADDLLRRASDEDVTLWRPSDQRLLGYLQAHQDAGVEYDPALILDSNRDARSASESVEKLLNSPAVVTAIFCTGAALTYGAYRVVVDRGLGIPDELSFVGFDDQDWMTLVRPTITVVDQPRYRIGTACTNMLLAQILGVGSEVDNLSLPASLITRASTTSVNALDGSTLR
ncbi:LacI family DNA-binding transcriptional regulator [Leifsonia sp. RAF41]|uniref:LacI family DNA-binding transcriptional regulator n=1 Tax=Leifsonia sp. RAF41 TaxID=3233056 RepID=UPI003F947B14